MTGILQYVMWLTFNANGGNAKEEAEVVQSD